MVSTVQMYNWVHVAVCDVWMRTFPWTTQLDVFDVFSGRQGCCQVGNNLVVALCDTTKSHHELLPSTAVGLPMVPTSSFLAPFLHFSTASSASLDSAGAAELILVGG